MALISGGEYCLPFASTQASPFGARTTLNGTSRLSRSTSGSSNLRPMKRLIEKIVFSELVMAWRLATSPTSRSPFLVKATTEGVVRLPSELGMTTGSPPSITATQLLVVPRSIPMTLPTKGASSHLYFFSNVSYSIVELLHSFLAECDTRDPVNDSLAIFPGATATARFSSTGGSCRWRTRQLNKRGSQDTPSNLIT